MREGFLWLGICLMSSIDLGTLLVAGEMLIRVYLSDLV